ncbi:MAG TPA: GNAT family N-acetyltransferase [Xanthobacteraceae bacterium]
MSAPIVRDYRDEDCEAAVALWLRAWDAALPEIDFSARLEWWRERWIKELVPNNTIRVAELEGRIAGFVVIDLGSGYLDQIAVAPEDWGTSTARMLMDEAKRISPARISLNVNQENARAIRFYERAGFERTGEGVNPLSGRPTWRYAWKPG